MIALVPGILLPSDAADASGGPEVAARSALGPDGPATIFSVVSVTFDRPVRGVSAESIRILDGNNRVVRASVSYDAGSSRATIHPRRPLRPAHTYTVSLGRGIVGENGSPLAPVTWSFTTTAQPSRGGTFPTPRSVRFKPGTFTGIRVDANGAVTERRPGTLDRPSWATSVHRARIHGEAYFFIVDGIWAGFYVPTSAVTTSRKATSASIALPFPTSAPSFPAARANDSSPTPSPTVAADLSGRGEDTAGSAPSTGPSNPERTPQPAPVATPKPPQPTPAPATPTAAPPAPAPVTAGAGILISTAEIQRLPMSGPAWNELRAAADAPAGQPNLTDMNQDNNVRILAKALVYARTGDARYRADVVAALRAAMGSENGGETLALGRELAAYVIAADLVGLRAADPGLDAAFRTWLRALLTRPMADGSSLSATHERRPNNWGTHAGASRAAVAAYLGDSGELARVAAVFRGWTGERSAYAGFKYGDLWWQSNASAPVGINPPGATLSGKNVDGVLPEEQRRTGAFTWPPPCGNYPHGAMDGALLTAEILSRAGYPAYGYGQRALLRAEIWLQNTGCPPSGDNVWHLPLLDARYGTSFWNGATVRPGKNFGWTDWLYAR